MIGFGQNVRIPDANFKAYLKTNLYNSQVFTAPQFQWKLDSTVTPSFTEAPVTSFKYDTQGNLIETTTKYTPPINFFDSIGNIIYTVDGAKSILGYDIANNPITYCSILTNGAVLDTMNRFTLTWDTNQLIERTQFKTNFSYWFESVVLGGGGTMGENSNSYLYYNVSNENILIEVFEWDGISYSIPIRKIEKTYLLGNPVLEVSYDYNITYWDTSTVVYNTWVNGNLIIKIYNGINVNVTSADTIFYNYNSIPSSITATSFPENSNQIIDSYDNQGNASFYYYSPFINSTGISDISNNKNKLVKITDLLGRETKGTKNEVLFYIYDDGRVEKRIVIE
jgi:hypothetical protein